MGFVWPHSNGEPKLLKDMDAVVRTSEHYSHLLNTDIALRKQTRTRASRSQAQRAWI